MGGGQVGGGLPRTLPTPASRPVHPGSRQLCKIATAKSVSPCMSSSTLTQRARTLRSKMTAAERLLWRTLRRHAFGRQFRRQEPIGRYIVDFVCFERRVVVEVDGGQHLESQADTTRDRWL